MPDSTASSPSTENLDYPVEGAEHLIRTHLQHLLLAFVAVGVVVRLVRYLLGFPLWPDEAFLAASFIDRDLVSILDRLEYNMVAPPLFLWGELAMVRLLGFSELSLRLIPTLASVASLGLFWLLARRWLAGLPLLLAVGIFAVSYYPIRHGNEIKPYATDLLASLALLVLGSQWLKTPSQTRWLYALALTSAAAVLGSFPAVFVAGGVSIALAWPVWKSRDRGAWLGWGALNACILLSFGVVYWLSVETQYSSYESAGLKALWNADFPPLSRPLALAGWIIERHTGHMFSYPNGGGNYASTATTLLILTGSAVAWARGSRLLLALCWAPLALCFMAAALQRYPYGGSARTMQFIAPAACLLAGLGAARLVAAMRRPVERRWAVALGSAVLLIYGGGMMLRDITAPYKTVYDERSREFARWFWKEQARDAALICVKRDQGVVFDPTHWSFDRSAVYQCQRAIYGAPLANSAQSDTILPPSARRVRCVLYNEHPRGNPKFDAWLATMLAAYELQDVREYLVNPGVVVRNASYEDRYMVYEFVARADGKSTNKVLTTAHRP